MKIALVIIACICFVLAGLGVALGPITIGWLGLAFFAASTIVP